MNFSKKNFRKIFYYGLILGQTALVGYAPINFNKPYDANFRFSSWPSEKSKNKIELLKVVNTLEIGSKSKSLNWNKDSVGLLSIYQDTQSSLAMLLQAPQGSDAYNLQKNLQDAYTAPNSDGSRGAFRLSGKFEGIDYSLYSQFNFKFESIPGRFDFTAYLPVRSLKIKNVVWTDLTKSNNAADLEVKANLTDNIASVVQDLGGLDIGNWSKTGIGDLALILRWSNTFYQYKRALENVKLAFRAGLVCPTGVKKNEDKTFSMPLGNDGAWAIPLGVSLDLAFKYKLRFGLDLETLNFLDETKVRRLKTDANQTDFLFLNKGLARKTFGNLWTFNMYGAAEHFLGGLSAKLNYQYSIREDDSLHVRDLNFNQQIANTAQSLQESNFHNFIFELNYDFYKDFPRSKIKPQLNIFYKLPFTGRRVINCDTFGGALAFNF